MINLGQPLENPKSTFSRTFLIFTNCYFSCEKSKFSWKKCLIFTEKNPNVYGYHTYFHRMN